ncbi:MAG: hypothetical protein JWP97_3857 [Labilithrix sp.]|nr:hypothetical protein [Labilithrix sp.]
MLLDMNRCFMPEALAGLTTVRALGQADRRRLNQIRACSYLHLFDVFEDALANAARQRTAQDAASAEVLGPLLRGDSFDHHELLHGFETALSDSFPVTPRLVPPPLDLAQALTTAEPLALLVLALHLKLVTQQHYLACVRGDEALEPNFVGLLKEHWGVECGKTRSCGAAAAIQDVLAHAAAPSIPVTFLDYRGLVFACDDVLGRQAALDVATLEDSRGAALEPGVRVGVLAAQTAAHRKTFLTVGIVNHAFVYAMRTLGPTAPAVLAGVVSALGAR